MADEYKVSEAAKAFNPERPRSEDAKSRKSEISDRVRLLSTGILAVVWGLFVGESKGPGISSVRTQLLWAAGLSISALLLDYCESLFGFTNAKVRWGNWLRNGVNTMFFAKQVATIVAVIALLVGACRLIRVPSMRAQTAYSYWSGSTEDDQTRRRDGSAVCISDPDPNTQMVVAKKDSLHCDGFFVRGTTQLHLDCEQGFTMTGDLLDKASYTGVWKVDNSIGQASGAFAYTYVSHDMCPN